MFSRQDIHYPIAYPKLTESQIKSIVKHCNTYGVKPIICAYYENWEDFCSDWCDDLGYTRTQARAILSERKGEFLKFRNGEILRFS